MGGVGGTQQELEGQPAHEGPAGQRDRRPSAGEVAERVFRNYLECSAVDHEILLVTRTTRMSGPCWAPRREGGPWWLPQTLSQPHVLTCPHTGAPRPGTEPAQTASLSLLCCQAADGGPGGVTCPAHGGRGTDLDAGHGKTQLPGRGGQQQWWLQASRAVGRRAPGAARGGPQPLCRLGPTETLMRGAAPHPRLPR